MGTFHAVVANSLAAFVTNTFVWFAVTFWVYLGTRSVVATAVMAGVYTATVAVSGIFLGSLVDRFPKKTVMLLSGIGSLLLYAGAGAVYLAATPQALADPAHPLLWLFIVLALFGAMAGNVRSIALSTLVTLLVPEEGRDRANGLVGTANGVAFLAASVFSGLAVGTLGMGWVLALAAGVTLLVLGHLWTLDLPARATDHSGANSDRVDLRGTIAAIGVVPGLFGLIFFHTFNNFLGGIFMALMDAYGLELMSVEVWGLLWGFLSLGFIVGGLIVARKGLGRSPLRTLFLANIAMWAISSVFTLQASALLLTAGLFVWLCLMPVVEATEQTILQNVIPPERQGRVFGFAQSVEQAASPVTAFVIGPVAQFVFIPFMTTGAGVDLIGGWFGTGPDRGLALLFTVAGLVGLLVTLLAMRSRSYRVLSRHTQVPENGATTTEAITAS
ncbi:MFS transporter [Deinococcus sp. YIM 134068]|uniref:MFS transporter n=1 Tax=Deinococcus lichenicola TaxID=3118910 RepID=UPI002F93A069